MRQAAILLVPLLALAACSGPKDAASGRASAPAPGGGPSVDGPMLATPGLWRTTTTANGRKLFGANRQCVDAASQKADALVQDAPAETGCRPPVRRPIAGGFAYDLVCEQQGLKTVVSGEVKGDARHVIMISTTRMTGPDGDAMPPATVVVDSVHVGPCPAGMKPGDSVQEGVGPQSSRSGTPEDGRAGIFSSPTLISFAPAASGRRS